VSTAAPLPSPTISEDEFVRFYGAEHARVFSYLARRVGPTIAEDLTAEIFVRAWEGLERFHQSRGTFRGWVFGIATNLVSRHYRDEERQLRAFAATGIDTVVTDHGLQVAEDLIAREQSKRLASALCTLSADDRTLLYLRYTADLSVAEVAMAVRSKDGTVTSRLSRARTQLRRLTGGTGLD